jgi:FAD/FMN-containing dehydrogenase
VLVSWQVLVKRVSPPRGNRRAGSIAEARSHHPGARQRLDEIIRLHREHGVHINNPHVNVVEDGKAGGPLPPEVIELKKRFDPLGLLNPGKLRDWSVAA